MGPGSRGELSNYHSVPIIYRDFDKQRRLQSREDAKLLEQRGGKLLQLLPGTSSSQEQGERTVPERINYPRARGKPWPMYFDELPPKHGVDMLVFQSYVSLLEWIQWIDSMEN